MTEDLSTDDRPMTLIVPATPCCGGTELIQVDGTYRCKCGKRQERLAKITLLAQIFPKREPCCESERQEQERIKKLFAKT